MNSGKRTELLCSEGLKKTNNASIETRKATELIPCMHDTEVVNSPNTFILNFMIDKLALH